MQCAIKLSFRIGPIKPDTKVVWLQQLADYKYFLYKKDVCYSKQGRRNWGGRVGVAPP